MRYIRLDEPRVEKVATRMYKVYGLSGIDAGWIEPSYNRRVPWTLHMHGTPPEGFVKFKDAKESALEQARRY